MRYKKSLLILIASLLLTGCGKPNDDKSTDQKTEQTAIDPSTLMAYKARKGNLWLAIFKSDFNQPSSILKSNIIYSADLSAMPSTVEAYINKYSDKDGKVNLKTIRKSKGETDPFFMLTIRGTNPKTIEDYRQLITKLLAFSPEIPELDAAGKAFSERYVEMAMALGELEEYYKTSKEYKLDDFAQSAQLHDKLTEAYKNYMQANAIALVAYSNLYDELHNAQKMELKTQGRMISFNVSESLDLAQEIVNDVNTTFMDKGHFKDFDKSALEKKITQLESAVNELKLSKGNKDAVNREGLKFHSYDQYVDSFASFIVQSKVVLRDLQEKNVDSQIQTLNLEFEGIVSHYNRVIK